MEIKDFPYPELVLPKVIRDSKDTTTIRSFRGVSDYIHIIGKYIHTNIDLNFTNKDPRRNHAWILRLISSLLIRSLYIRNAFVESFNSRNVVGLFLPLKAWFETVGALASILDILERDLSHDELSRAVRPYVMGNRGKGKFRIGTVEAINVQTMIKDADKFFAKLDKQNPGLLEKGRSQFFTDFYDIASNPTHPSYDAYDLISNLDTKKGIWSGKEPDEIKDMIIGHLPAYGALLLAPLMIGNICEKIFVIEKENFKKIKSKKYFSVQ